ncbi:MAG: hypothetical protein AVDCRST_MAG53-15 [uncultured Solirubrobacteraceae bacterium]|uniref:Uncharacterized protein n=1 Tax=uncultured Solirubrobacteraceae bacterium TaxID=1162706 RepID=A0A6J4RFX7_9ACTN|nr:MAG: hypothetical protein AVDCRST_MAG53-15 [uncultured Solirubrobacteraceae bacterium]
MSLAGNASLDDRCGLFIRTMGKKRRIRLPRCWEQAVARSTIVG